MPEDTQIDPKAITCPKCDSKDVAFSKKWQLYVCLDCSHKFIIEKKFSPLRIFLSYGHDEYAALAEQLKVDLQNNGHEVWFDLDRLKPGGDWETYIEEGFEWVSEVPGSGRFILLMTPHFRYGGPMGTASTRLPGLWNGNYPSFQ
jgi:DNA-directed RNA polymerase subunit RPC12/RpoP